MICEKHLCVKAGWQAAHEDNFLASSLDEYFSEVLLYHREIIYH